jgi:hypothetical protein
MTQEEKKSRTSNENMKALKAKLKKELIDIY